MLLTCASHAQYIYVRVWNHAVTTYLVPDAFFLVLPIRTLVTCVHDFWNGVSCQVKTHVVWRSGVANSYRFNCCGFMQGYILRLSWKSIPGTSIKQNVMPWSCRSLCPLSNLRYCSLLLPTHSHIFCLYGNIICIIPRLCLLIHAHNFLHPPQIFNFCP